VTGAKKGTGPVTCSTCSGAGQVRRATRTPFGSFTQVAECPTCGGTGQVIKDPCNACGGKGVKQVRKKLKINIPAGVDSGTRLRVSGEGNAGLKGGPSGDLYVFLKVKNINITIASLDKPEEFVPKARIYVDDMLDWLK